MAAIKCSGSKVTLSRFALLAEADSDGEEEAVVRSCSCSGLACIHTLASPAAFAQALEMVRPRFWLWPADWDDHAQWPCCCTDPAHALDSDSDGRTVYTCSHGSWLMVNSAAEAAPREQDLLWGDLITIQDELDFAALPAAVRAEREAFRAAEAKAMAAAHVDLEARKARLEAEFAAEFAEAQKQWEAEAAAKGRGFRRDSGSTHSSAHAAAGGGAPAPAPRVPGKRYHPKLNLPMPCRCHCHDDKLGNIAPASSGINKKGEKFSYPAGCKQHDDFVAGRSATDCEFFHIGDAEFRIIGMAAGELGPYWAKGFKAGGGGAAGGAKAGGSWRK